ncbi:MAG: hypothetical protein IJ774_10610 [Selenomonadaceae bacterium]|nr:hypothetical protein [Selenomonadaceae bacterium]
MNFVAAINDGFDVKLTAAGYKGGFTNFVAAVKEYVQFLEGGGYYALK